MIKYDFKVNPWQVMEHNFPRDRNALERMKFLLRYAILAPSSHNTQPWKFSVSDTVIGVFANFDRWLKVADADQRELYISIGCAIENLLIAAEHFGYDHHVIHAPDPADHRLVAIIRLAERARSREPSSGDLFKAITLRHTNHRRYDGRPIPEADIKQLEECAAGEGIKLFLTSDMANRRKVDELISRADALQFADESFRGELGYWIGQGIFGTPWLLSKLSQMAVSYLDIGKIRARKDADVLLSAPVLGMVCAEDDDRTSQVMAGRVLERIYLTATSLGISLQPMSQILEVPEVKAETRKLLPEPDWCPQQPFRLGYAEPEKLHTPRRPLEESLV
jgi:nitroreductase